MAAEETRLDRGTVNLRVGEGRTAELLRNEAAGRDLIIAFVGESHRLDNRGSQVLKSL